MPKSMEWNEMKARCLSNSPRSDGGGRSSCSQRETILSLSVCMDRQSVGGVLAAGSTCLPIDAPPSTANRRCTKWDERAMKAWMHALTPRQLSECALLECACGLHGAVCEVLNKCDYSTLAVKQYSTVMALSKAVSLIPRLLALSLSRALLRPAPALPLPPLPVLSAPSLSAFPPLALRPRPYEISRSHILDHSPDCRIHSVHGIIIMAITLCASYCSFNKTSFTTATPQYSS